MTDSAKSLLARAATEAKARAAADVESREQAPTILSPSDVQGEYDGARLLLTTLGGRVRPITDKDLRVFQQNATTLGRRFKGGITPQGIIDQSREVDRQRARTEIRIAVPSGNKGGVMKVVTNAGPNSDVSRHFLTIELVNFAAAVASPKTPAQMADYLTRSQVKFDCDCGRHTYWYRYVATIGKFNAGRAETGYPKIRNPKLTGVACKHVLRAMAGLRQGQMKSYVSRMIEQARKQIGASRARPVTDAEARRIAEEQMAQKARIRTRAQQRGSPESKLKVAAKRAIENLTAGSVARGNKARSNIRSLLKLGVITQRQADAMLSRIKD